jgi:hypothetical protein
LTNPILWHAGHGFTLAEHRALAPAQGRAPAPPAGWFEKFSWKSTPATMKDWPTVAELSAKLREQLQQLTALIESLSPQQLSAVIDPARGRTLRWSILHGLHDEANHQGEMWLLWKLQQRAT